MIKLAVFDCDGVIVDTEPLSQMVISQSLTQHGLPIAPSECHRLFVGGTMAGVHTTAQSMGANLPDDWVAQMYDAMDAALKNAPLFEGVVDLFDRLEARGVQIAVASNGPMRKMAASLGASGLFERLHSRIYSAHEHGAAKPAPDLILAACRGAGVDPTQTVMVDDNGVGMIAAAAAGAHGIAFDTLDNRARFPSNGCHYAQSMAQVSEIIDRLSA